MEDTSCFLCGGRPADPARPVVVRLRDTGARVSAATVQYQTRQVPVPACGPCRDADAAAQRRLNTIKLAAMFVPAALAAAVVPDGRVMAGFLGLGVGWLAGIAFGAVREGKRRAHQHPAVQELVRQGWHYGANT